MKIIRIILSCFLALILIACMAIFIIFQTFDTDQYLPQITAKASIILGRPVSIGHVGLALSARGITLDAGPLTVADDPNFTTQPFIKIDRVRISPDFKALIFRREIHITNILLQSPEIHFIRSQEGSFNVQNIGQTIKRPNVDIVASVSSGVSAKSYTKETSPLSVGHPQFGVDTTDFLIKSITIQDAAISFIDQNRTVPLDIWLRDINASMDNFSLSTPFQLSLNASFYSNVPNVHANAEISLDRSLQINHLSLQADLTQENTDGLKGVSPEMSDDSILNSTLGIVDFNLDHLDAGASGGLAADGGISISDAMIKNFNIIKMLLSRTLGSFGGVDGIINKLGADDTIINKATAQFSFHGKGLSINNSLIQTNVFEFSAQGSIDQGLNVDMQTMLHLNTNVSATLVNELEGLKYLMDDSQRIAMGASLTGVIPNLKYKLNKDFKKKSKRMLIEQGGNMLGVLLGGQVSSQDQGTASPDQSKKLKKNLKNIFKSLLQ